jgi:hypothetical protein
MKDLGNAKHYIQIINSKFKNSNHIVFILLLTSLLVLTSFGSSFILSLIEYKNIFWFDPPSPKNRHIVLLVIEGVFIAPIIETFINQTLPYYFLNKVNFLKTKGYLILIISALFFGVLHCYDLFYIIYGFFMGLVLMYGYMVRIKNDKNTFYLIAISH